MQFELLRVIIDSGFFFSVPANTALLGGYASLIYGCASGRGVGAGRDAAQVELPAG